MQIEKKHGVSAFPLFPARRHGRSVAQEHTSLFPTQMALARWMNGGDVPHIHAPNRTMPARVAWYAQAQADFQSWLDAGGFQQADPICLDCALRNGFDRNLLDDTSSLPRLDK